MKKLIGSLFCVAILLTTSVFAENLFGDANVDEVVDISDIVFMRAHIVGNVELTNEQFWYADVNADEVVNISDVVIVRSAIVNNKKITLPDNSKKVNISVNDVKIVVNGVAFPELFPKGVAYNKGILALTNADISEKSEVSSPLYIEGNVEIQLFGENKITSANTIAINCAYGSLTFSGSGSLTAKGTAGIYCDKYLKINGATIKAKGKGIGAFGGYGVDITGGRLVASASDDIQAYGIASASYVKVTGGNVEATGETAAIVVFAEKLNEKPEQHLISIADTMTWSSGEIVTDEYKYPYSEEFCMATSFGNEDFKVVTEAGEIKSVENAERKIIIE